MGLKGIPGLWILDKPWKRGHKPSLLYNILYVESPILPAFFKSSNILFNFLWVLLVGSEFKTAYVLLSLSRDRALSWYCYLSMTTTQLPLSAGNTSLFGSFLRAISALKTSLWMFLVGGLARLSMLLTSTLTKCLRSSLSWEILSSTAAILSNAESDIREPVDPCNNSLTILFLQIKYINVALWTLIYWISASL